MEASEKMFI